MTASAWERRVDRLCDQLRKLTEPVKVLNPYGVDDASLGPWCEDCAPAEAWNLNRGGYAHEDAQMYCDKCGVILDHLFTEYGVEQELSYSAEEDSPIEEAEAFTILNCIDTGYPKLTCRCGVWEHSPELKPLLRKIMRRIPSQSSKPKFIPQPKEGETA